MNPKEVLTQARGLIAKPENWTKGSLATTRDGWPVSPADEPAAKFCSIGAIHRAVGLDIRHASQPSESAAANCAAGILSKNLKGFSGFIAAFNDAQETTHKDVLAAFDRAIDSIEDVT